MTSIYLYKERRKASRAVKVNGNLLAKAQLPCITDSGNNIIEPQLPHKVTIKLTLIFKNHFS